MVAFALFLAAFLGMELVAYLTPRFLMHGSLWFLHESHHVPRSGKFEKNDFFGIFFALPSIVLIYLGTQAGYPNLLWIGLGMTAYGACYFLVHDVLVHRRVRIPFRPARGYMLRVLKAHEYHHRTTGKHGAVSFGFLYAPPLDRLDRQYRKRAAEVAAATKSAKSSEAASTEVAESTNPGTKSEAGSTDLPD